MLQPFPDILIVDDDEAVRDSLSALFTAMGYSVRTADSSPNAWTLFEAHRPDVILTDIYMPNGDGIELISQIRAASRTVPIIVISEDRPRGYSAGSAAVKLGANAVVSKSDLSSNWIETVDRLLAPARGV